MSSTLLHHIIVIQIFNYRIHNFKLFALLYLLLSQISWAVNSVPLNSSKYVWLLVSTHSGLAGREGQLFTQRHDKSLQENLFKANRIQKAHLQTWHWTWEYFHLLWQTLKWQNIFCHLPLWMIQIMDIFFASWTPFWSSLLSTSSILEYGFYSIHHL